MDKTNFKHEQILAIKQRLNSALEKSGMSLYKLSEALKNNTEFSNIHFNTVQSALDYSKDALDITVVIAMCRLLHLDTAYILSPPGTTDPGMPDEQSDTGKFIILDDPKYFGTFHGIFFSPNHKSSELMRFELKIQEVNGKATATMYYHGLPRTVDWTVVPDDRTIYGTPCLCTNHSNIYITLTNDLGDFYFLYFNRQKFRSHGLYFRRGIALTASSLRDHPVMLQNFVLFARRVPDEKLAYIPGLLADVNRTFHISKLKMDEMRKIEPLIENFYQCFKHILNHDAERMFPINEEQILNSHSPAMDKEDIVKALLLIKGGSDATNRTVYEDVEDYSAFSKDFLQQPDHGVAQE